MREQLVLATGSKIIFLIFDGLGDIPNPAHGGTTPLEAAKKPNLDALAMERGVLGRTIPVGIGITPGSGPGHLSLFGYDPARYEIGRGILEVLGLDMDLQSNDVAARGNFCTMKDGLVVDRRAGRIETSETVRLCGLISKAIPSVEGVQVIIQPGVSHRFGIIFRGEGLSDGLDDTDPHKEHKAPLPATPRKPEAARTAEVIDAFVARVNDVLRAEPVANGILLRGFSRKPDIPLFPDTFRMESLAIATYPMYRGIAKVVGMKVEREPRDYAEMVAILREHYDRYQFFFMHVKETDVAGEDGNFKEKTKAIETVDKIVADIAGLNPTVLVVTGDHSTPCPLKGHSWHPVPLLIVATTGERDGMAFHEKNCTRGSLGVFPAKDLMTLALAHGAKLDKYGA